jgi:hypothetical protein
MKHDHFFFNNMLTYSSWLLDSVVMVTFQIIFCVEIHANDVFLFLKNYF